MCVCVCVCVCVFWDGWENCSLTDCKHLNEGLWVGVGGGVCVHIYGVCAAGVTWVG